MTLGKLINPSEFNFLICKTRIIMPISCVTKINEITDITVHSSSFGLCDLISDRDLV